MENKLYLALAIFCVVGLVATFFLFRKKIKALLSGKIGGVLKNFVAGLKSVKDLERPFLFVVQSFLIWVLYFLSLYVCFWCFDETKDLGIKPALCVLLFGTLGVLISPGGIGAYQIIATQVMLFYGVARHISISFPWIVWGAQFIAIIVIGGLCFLLLPLMNRARSAG